MHKKVKDRQRRAKRARMKIRELGVIRLSVHRTPRHIYAQLIDADNKVIAVASTLEQAIRNQAKNGGNIAAAKLVGQAIAEKAKANNIASIAFDRSGFKYHGRVKALADAVRNGGVEF